MIYKIQIKDLFPVKLYGFFSITGRKRQYKKLEKIQNCKRKRKTKEEINNMQGMISEITSFSTHDGPGIRTTVFLKGCPLRCRWCSNPETWNPVFQLYFMARKCSGCGKCEQVCPVQAIGPAEKGKDRIRREDCTLCKSCLSACLPGAYRISGTIFEAEELFRKIQRDKPFFGEDGGLTISGGEPLSQPEFVREMFSLCKKDGISTVLDTSGYGKWEDLERILPFTDLVLLDLKAMDHEVHRKWTGVSNQIILENAVRIASRVPVRISLPLIPGVNDDRENLQKTAEFAIQHKIEWIDLNPFHALGAAKYESLGMESPYEQFRSLEKEEVEQAAGIFRNSGLKVSVGRMM